MCSIEESQSYRFGTTQGWQNCHFWANYPFNIHFEWFKHKWTLLNTIHTKDDNYNYKVLIVALILLEQVNPQHNYNNNHKEEHYCWNHNQNDLFSS